MFSTVARARSARPARPHTTTVGAIVASRFFARRLPVARSSGARSRDRRPSGASLCAISPNDGHSTVAAGGFSTTSRLFVSRGAAARGTARRRTRRRIARATDRARVK